MKAGSIEVVGGVIYVREMEDFVALDLETANANLASICEVGLVRFRNGEPVERWSRFVAPPDDLFFFENTWIHGISEKHCMNAPTFLEVSNPMLDFIGGLPLVAHHTGFDMAAIRKVSEWFGVPYPPMTYFCTVVMSRKALRGQLVSFRLQKLADYFGLDFSQVHRAESDAEAAGWIAVNLMKTKACASLSDLARVLEVKPGELGPAIDVRCKSIYSTTEYKDLSPEEKGRLARLQHEAFGVDGFDPSGDFFGKKVVLTGALQSMTRHQAKAVLESVGAIVVESVSKATDFVIQGEQKADEIAAGGSRKEKQAEKLLSEGVEIEVIPERDFVRLLLN